MGRKDEQGQPILVARDRDTKMTLSFLVQAKGSASEYVIKRLVAFLQEFGHHGNKLICISDQESPINAVAEGLSSDRGEAQTILENSPVGRQEAMG